MAPWFEDPLDALIANLDRTVPPALHPHGHGDVASMAADYIHICRFVQALLSPDPTQLPRVEADPHVRTALANLAHLAHPTQS